MTLLLLIQMDLNKFIYCPSVSFCIFCLFKSSFIVLSNYFLRFASFGCQFPVAEFD